VCVCVCVCGVECNGDERTGKKNVDMDYHDPIGEPLTWHLSLRA